MRNPQELAFDKYGNLFTGDNNCDHGDPGALGLRRRRRRHRLAHRLPAHHDAAGRPGRGSRRTSTPSKPTTRWPTSIPPIAHLGGGGPSGITYYPGTSLPAKYDNHFFLTDFRAGPTSSVMSFEMKPKGASFELVDKEPFVTGIVPTDVEFGPEGGAYISDWIGGFPKTGKGRIYRVPRRKRRRNRSSARWRRFSRRDERAQGRGAGVAARPRRHARAAERAVRARRSRAWHSSARDLLTSTAKKQDNQLARIHAIWHARADCAQGQRSSSRRWCRCSRTRTMRSARRR